MNTSMKECDLCEAKNSVKVLTNGLSLWQKCSDCGCEYVTPDMSQLNAVITKLKNKGVNVNVSIKKGDFEYE